MEFKDVAKLLIKCNSYKNDAYIDSAVEELHRIDHKSILPSLTIYIKPHSMFKLQSGNIISILDYTFLSGDITEGVVLEGDLKGSILEVYESLGIENRLLYSRVNDFVDTSTTNYLILGDYKLVVNSLKKYILIESYSKLFTKDELFFIKKLYKYLLKQIKNNACIRHKNK